MISVARIIEHVSVLWQECVEVDVVPLRRQLLLEHHQLLLCSNLLSCKSLHLVLKFSLLPVQRLDVPQGTVQDTKVGRLFLILGDGQLPLQEFEAFLQMRSAVFFQLIVDLARASHSLLVFLVIVRLILLYVGGGAPVGDVLVVGGSAGRLGRRLVLRSDNRLGWRGRCCSVRQKPTRGRFLLSHTTCQGRFGGR